ncbi:MAG: AAA family ATPase [Verrucomicrobiaceae bacterium]|nr:AAA family ATPase [Verrucomicrobiaceae bacterium]
MGKIITFYSYKGGVGRTMALSNVAVLLTACGFRVLVVDWDLEAPGLEQYFSTYPITPPIHKGGIFGLLGGCVARDKATSAPEWREYTFRVDLGAHGFFDMLPSGIDEEGYQQRLIDFSWSEYYDLGGGEYLESLRSSWIDAYDFVLIDSRTGVTDAGSVCTIHLPDILVLVFTANEQSLLGVTHIAERASLARQQFGFPRLEPIIIPLLSRWAGREEKEEGDVWLAKIENIIEPFMRSWAPADVHPRRILENLRVPHVSFYTFGEKLPVILDSLTESESPAEAFSVLSALLIENAWGRVKDRQREITEVVERQKRVRSGKSVRRLFLSMVSDELRSCRELLARDLERSRVEVTTQEKFGYLGATTLEKLDNYIRGCDAVIHLVGDGLGHVPPAAAVDALLERHTDFLTTLAPHTGLTRELLGGCSYTQWEAYLAIYHHVRLHIYRPDASAPRQPGFVPDAAQKRLQAAHFDRIRALGFDRDVFLTEERLSSFVLADLHDILPPRGESAVVTCIPRLPHTPRELIGREPWLARLDTAWQDAQQHIVIVRAWGGVGKTALVNAWMAEMEFKDWRGAQRVFYWSFYSQGTRRAGETTASADTFIARALSFFGDPDPIHGSPWDRGERLARLVGKDKTLLVLDGLEPLQYPPGPMAGQLTDPAITALLSGLAAQNAGLCLVTTRENVTDLDGRKTALTCALDQLSPEAGAALLHHHGVKRAGQASIAADDAELRVATTEVQGHALTLTLMGKYLALIGSDGIGDIRQRDTFRFADADPEWVTSDDPDSPYGNAFGVVAAYEHWLSDETTRRTPRERSEGRLQLAILRLLGLFNRPATADCLTALRQPPVIAHLTEPLADVSDRDWTIALNRLATAGLITRLNHESGIQNQESIDAHPLVREYFGQQLRVQQPQAFQAAHSRLFDHLCQHTPHRPDTLEGLQPLYQAVVHGCLAERQHEALYQIYVDRILRGTGDDGNYSTKKLGAIGADLGAVAAFFEVPWSRLSPNLSEGDQAWLLNEVAFSLRALGRLTEALEPMRAGLELLIKQQDWRNAAQSATNLSELEVTLGRLGEAEADARRAIEFADRGSNSFRRMADRTTAANALHQRGESDEARQLFEQAEDMQRMVQPQFDLLYSLRGFCYCDLILASAERAAWAGVISGFSPPNPAPPTAAESSTLPSEDGLKPETTLPSTALAEAERRATQTLGWMTQYQGPLLDIALDHLTLARLTLYRALLHSPPPAATPNPHLPASLDGLRQAGTADMLPLALLTAALHHHLHGDAAAARQALDEAQRIAERGPMPLFLADVHLHRARLFRDRAELTRAATLIRQHHYGRRLPELHDAESAAQHW